MPNRFSSVPEIQQEDRKWSLSLLFENMSHWGSAYLSGTVFFLWITTDRLRVNEPLLALRGHCMSVTLMEMYTYMLYFHIVLFYDHVFVWNFFLTCITGVWESVKIISEAKLCDSTFNFQLPADWCLGRTPPRRNTDKWWTKGQLLYLLTAKICIF